MEICSSRCTSFTIAVPKMQGSLHDRKFYKTNTGLRYAYAFRNSVLLGFCYKIMQAASRNHTYL
jgi:hypothetical protein